MRYVYFKHLKANNFLSIGKKFVEIDFKPGLNIITGKNFDKADRANGVGKSTIADAIHFALYGSTIRDIKKENIVNDQAPSTLCTVELEFAFKQNDEVHNCKIVRTLNPTKCFLYIDGVDVTRSGVPQTTELIIETIQTSSEVFQNAVVMTINNTVPFMAQKKVDKRKFIEGILGLEVFSSMLLQARNDFNECKKELDIEVTKSEEVQRSLVTAIKQKETYETSKKTRIEQLLTRQQNNSNELIQIKERLSKLDPVDAVAKAEIDSKHQVIQTARKETNKALEVINARVTEAKTYVTIKTDSLKKLKKVSNKCPHCGKDLAEAANAQYEKDKVELEKEIELYTARILVDKPELDTTKEQIAKLDKGLELLAKRLQDFAIRRKDIENINKRITELDVYQNQLIIDIAQLNSESTDYQEFIDTIVKRLDVIKVAIVAITDKIDIIESAKLIVSEEGVKSYIVKKIIEVLNGRLLFYLKKLESNSIVKLDEFFEESITNERGVECSYFNFSGAERKAIDLAMLFTFQDIRRAQANVYLNLTMFDELLDSSLDEKGIELVLDILKDRVDMYNEAIYIISHRKESKKYCIGGEIIYLEKKNGITTRSAIIDNT